EAARFEVCGHRWVHLAEPGYGVAVVNDSTYGHDVTRTVREDGGTTTTVGLSLVRAPRIPDPEADQGRHRLTYALLPGAGIEDAVAEGYALNLPLRVADSAGEPEPVVLAEGEGVTVEAVKLADDGSGDVVVRLYECRGGRASGFLRTGFPLARAEVTDLLERPLEPAETDGDAVPVRLRPFEVRTLRLAVSR
ncbi:glycosyl hydrolase-related protein, partial [Streptomyces broussonetiae]|uniref:glycosyl hydrolase-related protein n=1 Tax=Streptomyces broussonetiae TaxID=2686304 RepID=UPI0035D57E5D